MYVKYTKYNKNPIKTKLWYTFEILESHFMNYDDDFVSLAHAEDLDSMKKILGFVGADGIERAVRVANQYGYSEIVEFLVCHTCIPNVQQLLNQAVFHGHLECVKWMLSVADPQVDNSNSLAVAVLQGHDDIFELLYPVSNPQQALFALQQNSAYDADDWIMLEQRIHKDQREKLAGVVPRGCDKQIKKL